MKLGSIARWVLFGASGVGFGIALLNFVASAWFADTSAASSDMRRRATFLADVYGALALLLFLTTILILVLNVRWHHRARKGDISLSYRDGTKTSG
ncbi:MAG: hypothetical protein WCD49_17275 [Candidatus Acidiferrales bacterium]